MFKILGADGKEYGPVSADQLRQWIGEGRAGAQTQVRAEGGAAWTTLKSQPEFADFFQAPQPVNFGSPGTPHPTHKLFGVLQIGAGVLSLLWTLFTFFSLLQAMQHMNGQTPFTGRYWFYQGLSWLGIVIRFVSGGGLLRGREWARKLAVYYAVFAALMGLYGLTRTLEMISHIGGFNWMTSLSFVFTTGFSVVLLLFNVATIFFLSRKDARSASA